MENASLLPSVWDVPETFRNRLGDQVGRQRAMLAEGHVLIILHEIPSPEDVKRTGKFFWRHADGSWRSNAKGAGAQAIRKHMDEYFDVITQIEERDDRANSAAEYFAVVYEMAPVLRSARNMHLALQQARELCPNDRDIINFRDRAYLIERTAELLMEDAKSSLDFLIAKRTEEQAESSHRMAVSSHRLNVLVAIFFPMATLSALFGVNLLHGMETVQNVSEFSTVKSPSFPFVLLVVIGILLGVVVKSFVTSDESRAAKERARP